MVSRAASELEVDRKEDHAQSVHTVCVMLDESVDASLNSRPFWPSRRHRFVFCHPLASGAGVAEMAGLWKMLRACPPPQILVGSPEQAGARKGSGYQFIDT